MLHQQMRRGQGVAFSLCVLRSVRSEMFIAHVLAMDRSSFRSEMTKRYSAPKGALVTWCGPPSYKHLAPTGRVAPGESEGFQFAFTHSLSENAFLCAGHNISFQHFAKIRPMPRSFRTNSCCARASCANFPPEFTRICRSGNASR